MRNGRPDVARVELPTSSSTQVVRPRARAVLFVGKQARQRAWIAFVVVILAAGSITMLFPVIWMLSTSLKFPGDILLLPPRWIPLPPRWRNYPEALSFMRGATVYRNTGIVTVVSVAGDVLSSAWVAYGFARLRSPFRNVLFILLLSTLMIPYQVRLIPEYLVFAGKVITN